MLYPFKFHPVYKNYIWGGNSLSRFGKTISSGEKVAESWEVSAHPNGTSVIVNGTLAGMSLPEAVRKFGRDLIGYDLPSKDMAKFPLLVKLIDAADNLSVQVHPDDHYAAVHENGEYGKNEAWLILDAEPGSRLIAGVKKGVTREIFARAVADGSCLQHLNQIAVSPGDVINIPAGLVHAIGKGIIICEVQQNSDTTYRVFDYNRRDSDGNLRPLHVAKALDVINFQADNKSPVVTGLQLTSRQTPGLTRTVLVLNRYINMEKLSLTSGTLFTPDRSRFFILTVLSGEGELVYDADLNGELGSYRLSLVKGETVLLPACMGAYSLNGKMEILQSCPSVFRQDLENLARKTCKAESAHLNPGKFIAGLQEKIAFDPLPENLLNGGGGD